MRKFIAGLAIGSGVGVVLGTYGTFRILIRGKALDGLKEDMCDGLERLLYGTTRERLRSSPYAYYNKTPKATYADYFTSYNRNNVYRQGGK